MVTRTISIAEFEAIRGGPRGAAPDPLMVGIRAMKPGEAFILTHECGDGTKCRVQGMVGNQREVARLQGLRYKTKHLPNGDLAVACYEAKAEGA